MKSTLEKFFLEKLFNLLNMEMFLSWGKISFIISKQSWSLVNFEKPSDFNSFWNSSSNLSEEIVETPIRFFFIMLIILGLCLSLE